ncbi:MAG: hypothetical protein R3208_06725, partial [Ketobacteraceae bacterium]|nr:hypothetical protein [Ketobacteraceae bacterium]
GPASACNDKHKTVYDDFVTINPEWYLATYPDADSLPPVPDTIEGGIGGLPGVQSLWSLDPWLAFQHTAFARYAECQADEAAILNLFASGYHPLALNEAFEAVLWLFQPDEENTDWRFMNHPSLGQRIIDNQAFINSNGDRLPSVDAIQASTGDYRHYITMADREEAFEAMRDNARSQLASRAGITRHQDGHRYEDYEAITVVDLVVALNRAFKEKRINAASASADSDRCSLFRQVYAGFTGKEPAFCLPSGR